MLAKEIKIGNIKRQREFIKRQFGKMKEKPRKDGDTAYIYVGYLFPENIAYFKEEGFDIRCIDTEPSITKGLTLNIFTISQNVVLSAEELEAAENVEYEDDEFYLPKPDEFLEQLIQINVHKLEDLLK